MQINKTSWSTTNSSALGRNRRYTKKTGVLTPPDVKVLDQTDLPSPVILQKSVSTKVNTRNAELKSPIANTPKGIKRKKKESYSSKL